METRKSQTLRIPLEVAFLLGSGINGNYAETGAERLGVLLCRFLIRKWN